MTAHFSPAQIAQLKREAKLLAERLSLSHSQSLDRIAAANGFDNWSLLMRTHHAPSAVSASPVVQPRALSRSEDEWRIAVRPRKDGDPRRPGTYRDLENISAQFADASDAVSFALGYIRSLLARPRFRIPYGSRAHLEMRWWLPYVVHNAETSDGAESVVLNRHYKPVGYTVNELVEYIGFPHLLVRLTDDQLQSFSHKNDALGYLFADESAPWLSRANAEVYFTRLGNLARLL